MPIAFGYLEQMAQQRKDNLRFAVYSVYGAHGFLPVKRWKVICDFPLALF
jgi:hypothetical protein